MLVLELWILWIRALAGAGWRGGILERARRCPPIWGVVHVAGDPHFGLLLGYPQGTHFGSHFGLILGLILSSFWVSFWVPLGAHFGSAWELILGPILGPPGDRIGADLEGR